jgi:hypothetical protein
MRTIFHVGQAKTGSTAMQSTFYASRDALASKGVLYPEPFKKDHLNHRMLFAHLFEAEDVPRHISKDFDHESLPRIAQAFARSIRGEVEDEKPSCVLLSSESRFSNRFGVEQRRAFKAMLEGIDLREPEIVVYIRRPSSYYLSSMQQHLRQSHKVKKPYFHRVAATTAGFVEDFGEANTHVRAFDRKALNGGDVVRDFVERYLAPHGVAMEDLAPGTNDNASLSAEGTDLARRFRLAFYPKGNNRFTKKGNLFLKALAKAEQSVKPPKIRMDPDLVERIDYALDDLLVLRDRHGLVMPDYDYDRIERGDLTSPPAKPLPLSKIVAIDVGTQLRLVEHLGRSRWAERMPSHARWLESLPDEIEREAEAARRHEHQEA